MSPRGVFMVGGGESGAVAPGPGFRGEGVKAPRWTLRWAITRQGHLCVASFPGEGARSGHDGPSFLELHLLRLVGHFRVLLCASLSFCALLCASMCFRDLRATLNAACHTSAGNGGRRLVRVPLGLRQVPRGTCSVAIAKNPRSGPGPRGAFKPAGLGVRRFLP